MNPESIEQIVRKHQGEQGSLIAIMEDIQARYQYLPEGALREVARLTKESLVDIYGVATFYKAFSLEPRGRHHVCVCLGTACHVRSAPRIVDEFSRQLGVKPGETTDDKEFTLETVNCLGACALGPIVTVDGKYFSNVKGPEVKKIISTTLSEHKKGKADGDAVELPLRVVCPHCGAAFLDAENHIEDHPAISLRAKQNGTSGWVRISSLHESTCRESEHDFPREENLSYSCPLCGNDLTGKASCIECGSPMASLALEGGGFLHICSRWECTSRRISLSSPDLPEATQAAAAQAEV